MSEQETFVVEHDCRLPRNGLIKIHLGFDFQGQGWFFETFGGGNIPEIAAFMMAHNLRKYKNFADVFSLIDRYKSLMPEPDIMWMRVYGDAVQYKGKDMTDFVPLPQYYGICFVDGAGVPLGFGICLKAGTFGFEGHFLPNGDPQTGVVSIYGGMAMDNKIYAEDLDGAALKINGRKFFEYNIDSPLKIETVEPI